MASISIPKNYQDGDVLFESDLDAIISAVETFLNVTKINDDNIQDSGISGTKLADLTIPEGKLSNNSVSTDKIQDDAVTADKVAVDAVYTAAIQDAAVTEDKLAANLALRSGVVGEVKMFHTFNGAISLPRGWMKLNGDTIDETNYDAIHGAGAYAADGVASSPLLSKNLPDMADKFAVGGADTTEDGSAPIATEGNSNHQVDLSHDHTVNSHSHTVDAHKHRWLVNSSAPTTDSQTYDATGTAQSVEDYGSSSTGHRLAVAGGAGGNRYVRINGDLNEDFWTSNTSGHGTSNSSPGTNSKLSATQSIKPESVKFIYIMKVI